VPFSEGKTAQTVEGIWQGLKVFQDEDIDLSKFEITNMEGIKRTVRKFGNPLGHRKGVNSKELLDYPTARKEIYLRTYAWVLDHLLQKEIFLLREKAENQDLVFLDYNTNENLDDYSKAISHAALVKKYLIKKYPELATLTFKQPLLSEKITEFILNELKNKSDISVTEVKDKFKLKNNKDVKANLDADSFEIVKKGNKEVIKLKQKEPQLFDN
jgi:hypothetical protein